MNEIDWAAVAASGYAVPERLNPVDALPKLLGMLDSPSLEIRDAQACMTLTMWTQAGHFDAVLFQLGSDVAAHLLPVSSPQLTPPDSLTDAEFAFQIHPPSILARSFCALILGEILDRDAKLLSVPVRARPVAIREQLQHMALGIWRQWYPSERDVRSHEEGVGWIHAVAHGADTARALALHPQTSAVQLRSILDTFTERLRTLPRHLSQTEDDRLALAMLAVFSRPKLTPEQISGWLSDYQTLWTSLNAGPIPPGPGLAVRALHSLHTLLHLDARVNGKALRPAYPTETLELVQGALRSVYPYYGQP